MQKVTFNRDCSSSYSDEDGPDEVESALLQARALIESSVSEHRRRASQRPPAAVEPFEHAHARSSEWMVGRARRSVSISVGSGDGASLDTSTLLAALAVRSGLALRLLCGVGSLAAPAVREAVRRAVGWEVRLAPTALREAVIIDGRVALIQSGRESTGRISIVREPSVVRVLELLFAGVWTNAESVAGQLRGDDLARSGTALRILEHLCAGRPDDAASRELGVSVRTYRRHVADLMQELGAKSRFQAGARAVELGLLA